MRKEVVGIALWLEEKEREIACYERGRECVGNEGGANVILPRGRVTTVSAAKTFKGDSKSRKKSSKTRLHFHVY